MHHFIALFPVLFLVVSCSRQEQKTTDLVTFPLRGEIVAIDSAKNRVTIDHEEIPDYMMAMTMPFKVKDPSLLRGLSVGDTIQGTLAVSRTESWLEAITVTGKGEEQETLTPEQIQLRHQFQPGEVLPDVPLVNQDGKTVRLSDFRGKVLAFTFIYTRCPIPDFCILMSNNFAKIQKALTRDRSLNGTWHLMSVSFDPRFDRPKTLKAYAQTYGAELTTWDFVTDPDTSGHAILTLADGLDLTYADDEGLIQHNLRTVVLDKEGRLVKVIKGNEWTVEEVAGEVKRIVIDN
jgi:protein SCO1/2